MGMVMVVVMIMLTVVTIAPASQIWWQEVSICPNAFPL